MKRILFCLSGSLALSGGLSAQDTAPAARLGMPAASLGRPVAPTIRGQAPELSPVAGFPTLPKTMPKGAVSETPGALPMPTTSTPTPTGPLITAPPSGAISGPIIYDPPGTSFGTGMPGGAVFGDLMPPSCPTPGCQTSWYTSAEAMLWRVKNYSTPALVTAGPAFSGANLAVPGVAVLYGGDVDNNPRWGGRFTLGYWCSSCWAVELSGFALQQTTSQYNLLSTSLPTLDIGRPFFSANRLVESSEIIGRPGVVAGAVSVNTKSDFFGGELNARRRWWNEGNSHLDFIGGFRYLNLKESLTIQEETQGLAGAGQFAGIQRVLTDSFNTRNQFYGFQVGAIFDYTIGRWSFDIRGKVAAGVMRQTSGISGDIVAVSGGSAPNQPGGLLALSSNIGSYKKTEFAFVPEIGVNVGYDITPRLRIFGGYSLMYISDVARPGKQIDRTLDENRIPDFGAAPAASGVHPVGGVRSESLWAQGVNVGLLFKW